MSTKIDWNSVVRDLGVAPKIEFNGEQLPTVILGEQDEEMDREWWESAALEAEERGLLLHVDEEDPIDVYVSILPRLEDQGAQ